METNDRDKNPHYRSYHNFKCRRCATYFHRSQVVRTTDGLWICKKCDSHDKEIAKKVTSKEGQ